MSSDRRRSGRGLARLILTALSMAALVGPASAEEPTPTVVSAGGRVLEAVTESGVTVWYVYDSEGALIEERYSDGRVIEHPRTQNSEPVSQE